jgi:hypothetical protein
VRRRKNGYNEREERTEKRDLTKRVEERNQEK